MTGKEKILIRLPGLTVKGQEAVNEYGLAGIVFGLIAHDNINYLGAIFLESIHDGLVHLGFHMPLIDEQYEPIYPSGER